MTIDLDAIEAHLAVRCLPGEWFSDYYFTLVKKNAIALIARCRELEEQAKNWEQMYAADGWQQEFEKQKARLKLAESVCEAANRAFSGVPEAPFVRHEDRVYSVGFGVALEAWRKARSGEGA